VGAPQEVIKDFLRPAIRAVPTKLAARLSRCDISLPLRLDGDAASRWAVSKDRIAIEAARDGVEPHDLAIDVLVCIGQVAWDYLKPEERLGWLLEVYTELAHRASGEIDEPALVEKRRLLAGPAAARSWRRMSEYARASFAGTVAEYVHALWHDVSVRTGPDHLAAVFLRQRLDLLQAWFPPDRGYKLFPQH
jgi:hypothetical protein